MKNYYVAQAYIPVATAGTKPMQDFDRILRKYKFHNIGFPELTTKKGNLWYIWNKLSSFFAKLRMPSNDCLVFQYPFQFDIDALVTKAKSKNNKVIIMIHDLDILRGSKDVKISTLKKADILIAHTEEMKSWIQDKYELNSIVVLNIFDYILEDNNSINTTSTINSDSAINIVYAGNLSKSIFLNDIDQIYNNKINYILFGPNLNSKTLNYRNIQYKGSCLPEELLSRISQYHFGLVWDGDSISTCTGELGNYLRFNCPYKISSYIAAGIPVIIWSEMGMAQFVKENNIGVLIHSLHEINDSVLKISNEEYEVMKKNVINLRMKLLTGYFYENAIKNALSKIG